MRIARVAATAAAILGVVMGLAFLFLPGSAGCSATTAAPTTVCRSIIESQPALLLQLLAIVAWSAAPSLVLLGLLGRQNGDRIGTPLIVAGIVITVSSLYSVFLAAFFFLPVLLATIVSSVLALRVPARDESTPTAALHAN